MTTFGIPSQAARGLYPACVPFLNGQGDPYAVVQAGGAGRPEQIAALLDISFGMTLWLALAIHAIGIEIYVSPLLRLRLGKKNWLTSFQIRLTPRESERLRQVSYERQQEAGLSHAGSSGLTADRFGDSEPWRPKQKFLGKQQETGVQMDREKSVNDEEEK